MSRTRSGSALRQSPSSPHPRAGTILDPNIPLDANHNPAGAYVNERRWSLASIWAQPIFTGTSWKGEWATTLSVSRNDHNRLRGFLIDPSGASPDANGTLVPQTQVYLAYIDFIDADTAVLPGNLVVAKVYCKNMTVAGWIWRKVNGLFDLSLW